MALQLRPAAITLDVIMKPIGGWKVLSQLKSDPRTAAIPVVVVTIVDQKNTGGLLGASEYVVKPVDKTILLNAIDRCLNSPENKSSKAHPILIVEDHPPTREFIAEMLSSNGYSVYPVGDGKQARARMQDELPSLVILDLILPDASGFQLLTEWRNDSLTAEIPVIVLTNKDLTPEERDYLGQNAGALFQKRGQWQEGLLRHIRHVVPTALVEQP
jgi:DNA-binding response OmpR family regulator